VVVELALNAILLPAVLVDMAAVDKEQDRARLIQQVQLILAVVAVVADIAASQMVLPVGQVL
jgi:hypothetical protein